MKHPLYTALLCLAALPSAFAEVTFPPSRPPIGILPQQPDCNRLYPVRSADDLIKQLYENLESGCLLDMKPEELAEKWQLPYYPKDDFFQEKDKTGSGAYLLHNKPYQKGHGNFILIRGKYPFDHQLQAIPTRNYLHLYGSLFHRNRYPDYLPTPRQIPIPLLYGQCLGADGKTFTSEALSADRRINRTAKGLDISKFNTQTGRAATLSFLTDFDKPCSQEMVYAVYENEKRQPLLINIENKKKAQSK